jgi:hypothetical protein
MKPFMTKIKHKMHQVGDKFKKRPASPDEDHDASHSKPPRKQSALGTKQGPSSGMASGHGDGLGVLAASQKIGYGLLPDPKAVPSAKSHPIGMFFPMFLSVPPSHSVLKRERGAPRLPVEEGTILHIIMHIRTYLRLQMVRTYGY